MVWRNQGDGGWDVTERVSSVSQMNADRQGSNLSDCLSS